MRSRSHSFKWQPAVAVPIFGIALALYLVTLAPSVATLFDDSLEFQLVTYQLGIAHPTGYPLYTLLGWLFTRLPWGDVAYRVNLMSAVFGAATVALVYLIGLELSAARAGTKVQDGDTHPYSWTSALGAAVGATALAVSPVFWSQTTVAEVYTLHSIFVALLLYLLTRLISCGQSLTTAPGMDTPDVSTSWHAIQNRTAVLAFVFGLGLTHHRTTVLMLPAIVLALWLGLKPLIKQSNSKNSGFSFIGDGPGVRHWWLGWLKVGLALLAPLLLYLYLPLRANIGSLDGNYVNTLTGFLQHVTASGYGGFLFDNPFGVERDLAFYLDLFRQQFGWVGMAAGLAGLVVLTRQRRAGPTLLAFATFVIFNLFYNVADIEVFFIPPFLIWSIWLGVCGSFLLNWVTGWQSKGLLSGLAAAGVTAILLGQSALILLDNLPHIDRSQDRAVYDYGLDVMRLPLEEGAAIIGIQGEITLFRYFQDTGDLRPDLDLIAADRESERESTAARLLDQGQAVYITRDLPGAAQRWHLGSVGPLIRLDSGPMSTLPDGTIVTTQDPIPEIVLRGYAIDRPASHLDPPPVRINLVWEVTAPIPGDLKVSARLVNEEGQPAAQADAAPVHFTYPTSSWRTGELVRDVYDIPLPADLAPGSYAPVLILYDPARGAAEVGRVTLPPISLP